MEIIYLVGFMGSGKSSVGKVLAEMTKLSYADTDTYIEQKYQTNISDIFAKKGEKAFRQYETEALSELFEPIISTGGGIVENEVNIQIMKKNGMIVYLKTSFSEILRRLGTNETRPLWNQDLASREALYKKRCQYYESCADFTIETDGQSMEAIAKKIISFARNREWPHCPK